MSHLCPKCKLVQPAGRYQLHKGKPNGWCRSCRTDLMRRKRLDTGITPRVFTKVIGETKCCADCGEFKSFTEFSPSARGVVGLAAYCKPCNATRYSRSVASRRATAKYRTDKSGHWLALHRIHQIERKEKIKVTSDGTVTPEFMQSLYERTICKYCNQETAPDRRTADHVVPLTKGGVHSVSNLEMACHTCNSKKRDLDVEVFMEKLSNDK